MQIKAESIENRMMVLEEKMEYQEYTIEKLNDVIINQQHQLDKLETKMARLRDRFEVSLMDVDDKNF